MNTFTIRPAVPADGPLIRKLASEVWYPTYEGIHMQEQLEYMFQQMYNPHQLQQQMEKGVRFFIGYDKEKPIGYISIEEQEKDLFYLHKLYILPDWQGCGAGKFLFQSAVDYIRQIHPAPCTLELNVNRSNPAIRFYERMGMQIYRESDDEIGEEFVMHNSFMRMQL
ncbi:MAG: GNAT family N-acetyltransferase [Tannerellaceae bacterium]|nr:GNAT family N-acetyltransferase [Tannerellaceae bacterium]